MSGSRGEPEFILLQRRGRRGGDELVAAPTLEELEEAIAEMTGGHGRER